MKIMRPSAVFLVLLLAGLPLLNQMRESAHAQGTSKTFKQQMSMYVNRGVVFDVRSLGPFTISEVNEDYIIVKKDRDLTFAIPFHAIQRVMIPIQADYPVMIYLTTHVEER
jgi:hypothetical protein